MTTNQNFHSTERADQAVLKVVLLADEINRLQSQLGGLRRQTGQLSDSALRVNVNKAIRR
jgi:hypothetical protein